VAAQPPWGDVEASKKLNLYYQAIYNQANGIPSAGRSLYEKWLADQWRIPVSNWLLSQSLGIDTGLTAVPTPIEQTFEDYMAGRVGQPVGTIGQGGYYEAMATMSPEMQQTILDRLPLYVEQGLLRGALRRQGSPPFMAQSLMEQAFAPTARETFEMGPQLEEGGTFLNYLREKYGLDVID